MKTIKPLLEKVTEKEDSIETYHAHTCISASGLKYIFDKDLSVKAYLNRPKMKRTPALEFGVASHVLLSEGLKVFSDQYFVMPKLDLRKTPDKELKDMILEKNKDKIALSNEDYKKLISMHQVLQNMEKGLEYIKGKIEVSHYGVYKGVKVRVRPDCIGDDWISDIKTCQDSSPRKFKSDKNKFLYSAQAMFYCEMLGYDPEKFRFIACEKNPPYEIQLFRLSEESIEFGAWSWRQAFAVWELYIKTGKITGFQGDTDKNDGSIAI